MDMYGMMNGMMENMVRDAIVLSSLTLIHKCV